MIRVYDENNIVHLSSWSYSAKEYITLCCLGLSQATLKAFGHAVTCIECITLAWPSDWEEL